MSIPEGYICPISHQIMQDPYIDTDGNSYERASIMEWLSNRQVSPITRRPLYVENLVPNRALKNLIEEYCAANPSYTDMPVALPRPPATEPIPLDRKPIMLFAVIDNSGSMGEPCGGSSNEEDDGFTRLDLVKHTMNTIITSLTKYDQICLIKFSTSAEVIAHVTKLTDSNKATLMQTMNRLQPEYSTNIWDGLRSALDIVAALPAEDVALYNVEVFLLTDGVPNINPPRPITETLENYLSKKCAVMRPKVHTFGYGYSLQSEVLYDLAKVGNGTFGFIPDSSMVGTVFINSLSSSLVGSDEELKDTTIDALAEAFCVMLRTLLRTTEYTDRVAQLTTFIASVEAKTSADQAPRVAEFLQALLLDCKETDDPNAGQIMKSIQTAFFTKWGKHYLYSVLSAFEHQICINFKDKAMQTFKSEKFKVEQERIEDVFVQLPAPTPSARRPQPDYRSSSASYSSGHHTAAARAPAPAPVSMNHYHHAGGGCFSGDSVVLCVVAGSEEQVVPLQVSEVRAGMVVLSHLGPTEVECVVKLRYQGPLYQGTVNCPDLTFCLFQLF